MILIYSDINTPRLNYVLDLIFNTILGIEYQFTTDTQYYKNSSLYKITYANAPLSNEVFIKPQPLLRLANIENLYPEAEKNYDKFPKFFTSTVPDFLGYDLFAMAFYFATRYEEYISTEKDTHQRFKAENSLAFQYKCLHYPFLNTAIREFSDKLQLIYPNILVKKRSFNFISTIDIDNAFAYANKGLLRNTAGFLKDLAAFKFQKVAQRINSCIDEANDPYNTFQYIHSLSTETNTALRYFVLIGDYGTYDKNPHFSQKGFRKLLQNLAATNELGLHPSYITYDQPQNIKIEKDRLENIIDKKITSARCHFLRINIPETYQMFDEIGITEDYSMIYASEPGFRTGLCLPYLWFDLQKNKPTNLTIHPSAVMEGTLRDYNCLNAPQALETINQLINQVKLYGGEFVSVFHNDCFIEEHKQWSDMYKKMLLLSH